VVPHGKGNRAKAVGEQEGPEEKVELAKLDSDIADVLIKSAVEEDKAAREKEPEEEAPTSADEAVSSHTLIQRHTKEEVGLKVNLLGFTKPPDETQVMTCVSNEVHQTAARAGMEMQGEQSSGPGALPEGGQGDASSSGGGDRGPRQGNRINNPPHSESSPGGSRVSQGKCFLSRNTARGGGPQWPPCGKRRGRRSSGAVLGGRQAMRGYQGPRTNHGGIPPGDVASESDGGGWITVRRRGRKGRPRGD
jgi:hypothetical protein